MYLIITIDTEEDNWGSYSPTDYTLENIERIPTLQDLFDEFNVKPTYLITYPVAIDERAISILKGIMNEGRCEIGTHCHPWNTPPFEENNNIKRNSMLCNLPIDLQFKKISFLHQTIQKNFGITPISFRAGRWGFNQEVAKNLFRLGYQIDTSITPFVDWADFDGPDFADIFPKPFKFNPESFLEVSLNGKLLEVPVTIGFLQEDFSFYNRLLKILKASLIKKLGLIGLLYKLRLVNMVWLSPESADSRDIVKLAQLMIVKNYKVVNMTFHSSSLKAGLNQFVKTKEDEERFLKTIREFLVFARSAGIESIKLSDATELI